MINGINFKARENFNSFNRFDLKLAQIPKSYLLTPVPTLPQRQNIVNCVVGGAVVVGGAAVTLFGVASMATAATIRGLVPDVNLQAEELRLLDPLDASITLGSLGVTAGTGMITLGADRVVQGCKPKK